ncbi:MAG: hypothetical protein IKN43_13445 [Selenomonadaceae bacterium]|nr:hypothetical protein [Selenomonadaceae bacterium]
MKLKKKISMLLVASMLSSSFVFAAPEDIEGSLSSMEVATYGKAQTGAVMERIERLEREYNGKLSAGSMTSRIDALYDELYTNENAPSKEALMNAIEWNVRREVSDEPLITRLSAMEMKIVGKTGTGTLTERLDDLSIASFGENQLPVVKTNVPAGTLIKIALSEPVTTKNIKVGDKVKYHVAADVISDGILIFTKGAKGEGKVTKVTPARNFGRNAELVVEFEKTKAMEGTYVDTYVGEASKTEMKNAAMAAGASIAGIALLGPVGIIAGAFVKGKNIELPEGTELYVETKHDTPLYGVQMAINAE